MRKHFLLVLALLALPALVPAAAGNSGFSKEFAESYLRTQDFAQTDFQVLASEINASRATSYELFVGNERINCASLSNCPALVVALVAQPASVRATVKTDAGTYLVRQARGRWVALRDVLPPFAHAEVLPSQPVPGGKAVIHGFGVDDTAISQVNISLATKAGRVLAKSCNSSDCYYEFDLRNAEYSQGYSISVKDVSGKTDRFSSSFTVKEDSTPPFLALSISPSEPGHNQDATITAEASDLGGVKKIEIWPSTSLARTKTGKTGKAGATTKPPEPAKALAVCEAGVSQVFSCNYSFNTQGSDWKVFVAKAWDWRDNKAQVSRKFFFGVSGPDSDSDGIVDEIERRIGTNANNPDSDADGLKDGEEFYGVDADGDGEVDVDLPNMGANPTRRDIFIEVDWMENATVSYRPSNAELQEIVNAFNRHGVSLHFDTGNLGGGNPLPYQPQLIWLYDDIANPSSPNYNLTLAQAYNNSNPVFQDFFDAKRRNFDPARLGYFRYLISAGKGPRTGSSSAGGNFFVSLNRSRNGTYWSGTIMHELGHTLGLGHGGTMANGTWDHNNYKPNYLSVMNYHFQVFGVPKLRNGSIVYELDYQLAAADDLDESRLNERNGIGLARGATLFTCPRGAAPANTIGRSFSPAGYNSQLILTWANGSIDWSCNGFANSTNLATNVNSGDDDKWQVSGTGTSRSVLVSRTDWDKLEIPITCREIGMQPDFGYLLNSFYRVRFMNNKKCPEDGGPSFLPIIRAPRIRIFSGDEDGSSAFDGTAFDGTAFDTTSDPELDSPSEPIPGTGEYCNGIDDNSNGLIDEGCLDSDSDSVPDDLDNCPLVSNPLQEDENNNFVGDACEKPAVPANVRVELSGVVRKISWDYSGNASSFNVYLASEDGSSQSFVGNTGEKTISDSSLLGPGSYSYFVSAVVPGGVESDFSDPAEFSVAPAASALPVKPAPPDDSSGLVVLSILLVGGAAFAYFLFFNKPVASAGPAKPEAERKEEKIEKKKK